MDIRTFLKQHRAAEARMLAQSAGTSHGYLRLLGYGIRRPSADLALILEHASAGLLTARQLRPDLPWPVTTRTSPDPFAATTDDTA